MMLDLKFSINREYHVKLAINICGLIENCVPKFKIIENAKCKCSTEKETVKHFLLNCELYDEERDALRRRVGMEGMRASILLGDP